MLAWSREVRELEDESIDEELWLGPLFAAELPGRPHCCCCCLIPLSPELLVVKVLFEPCGGGRGPEGCGAYPFGADVEVTVGY